MPICSKSLAQCRLRGPYIRKASLASRRKACPACGLNVGRRICPPPLEAARLRAVRSGRRPQPAYASRIAQPHPRPSALGYRLRSEGNRTSGASRQICGSAAVRTSIPCQPPNVPMKAMTGALSGRPSEARIARRLLGSPAHIRRNELLFRFTKTLGEFSLRATTSLRTCSEMHVITVACRKANSSASRNIPSCT